MLYSSKECNAGDGSLTGDPPEARLRNGEDSWFSAAISSLPIVTGMHLTEVTNRKSDFSHKAM